MQFLNTIRRLLRAEQLYKNLFIFLPLIFLSHNLLYSYLNLFIGFLGLCASSSITYIINDWMDRKKDALHPLKKDRPLASGKIKLKGAVVTIIILGVILGLAIWRLGENFGMIIAAHLILTNLYTFGLKNVPVLDIVLIAINFLLRMMAGIKELPDLYLFSYFLILFGVIIVLMSHKRRSDIKIMGEEEANNHKKVLKFYGKRNSYLIRFFAYILILFSLYRLWSLGLDEVRVLALFALLVTTSVILSLNPKFAIKPHYIIKSLIWDFVAIATAAVFLMPSLS